MEELRLSIVCLPECVTFAFINGVYYYSPYLSAPLLMLAPFIDALFNTRLFNGALFKTPILKHTAATGVTSFEI